MNKNEIESIEFFDPNNNPIDVKLANNKTTKNITNYFVKIKFKKLIDGFSLTFGESGNFKFYIHYNFQDKALYFEKIVNNLRMTLERLKDINLKEDVCIKYTQNEIVIYKIQNEKLIKLAQKQLWKTNTNVFTSLTFDNKYVYLKIVNIGDETKASFDLSGIIKSTKAIQTTYVESENKIKQSSKTLNLENKFLLSLKSHSLNILKIER